MFNGNRVKELREGMGFNQTDLSLEIYAKTGKKLTKQSISNWEAGMVPTVNQLQKLAVFFKVSLDYFMK